MQSFDIQKVSQVDDEIGGFVEEGQTFKEVQGYLDMLSGTDLTAMQNAFVEESTHVLVVPKFADGITDNMRIVDKDGRYYSISYVDNPVGIDHHNEIYCKYGGVVGG